MSKICRACAVDAESDFGGMNFSKLDYPNRRIAFQKSVQALKFKKIKFLCSPVVNQRHCYA